MATAAASFAGTQLSSTASARVLVRSWERRDRRRLQTWPQPTVPAHWLQAELPTGERLSFAVELKDVQVLIGRITLRNIEPQRGSARLGTYLHPQFIGRGYGTEALNRFCEAWLGSLGLSCLHLDVAADNHRAIRCYTRCGFRSLMQVQRNGYWYVEMERGMETWIH